ncbi:MAG: Substrate-specific component CbrT of predicted cobalamin ECF transporter [uncultured Chloroflexia bacterium]|uniref:Substrate-specific component CbrT of predicted cobalamin ECF transporter n=1 Tax=uncultured Chloroflexia bacterium TaxID=1672391 RepID=A0A6J4J9Z0_9CHLR|nr:MAG: Substrate-specific component CbrT of predicted cobalamin ECF transporter [uncultured Chloroflexia bacterium]
MIARYPQGVAPARPDRSGRQRLLAIGITAAVSLLGAAAFAYPFLLSAPLREAASPRASDAPVIFGLLMPLLLVLLLAELGTRRASAKMIAALGILTAINAVLRIPVGIGDSPSFFFLPILLGYVYGGRFGFLHGALSMFVSAVLTFGIGPWLPFQMFALGWLGMGAALLRPAGARLPAWGEIALLAAYGYAGGMAFGVLMNLYSWPVGLSGGGLGWQPGLGLAETARRYWLFYVTTSLTWDTLRGSFTAGFILLLGRPLLRELRRFQQRFDWHE